MTIPPIPAGGVETRIYSHYGDATLLNILHWDSNATAEALPATVAAFAALVADTWEATFLEQQGEEYTLDRVEADFHWSGGVVVPGVATSSASGADTGTVLPASSAMVISLRTSTTWRGGKGRMYVAGLVEDRLDGTQLWSAATVSDFQTAADTFKTDCESFTGGAFIDTQLCVLRRFADGGSEDDPPTYLDPPLLVPVAAMVARARIGSQRRRLIN